MKTHTLITGASQGLGKSIALEFANRKMNLVLVALPNSGLPELSEFIKDNYNVKTHYLELDLSTSQSCHAISEFIQEKQLQIKCLVNNAGVLSRGLFENIDEQFILSQIAVNVTTPTLLIKLLLDNMKSVAPASILNISSMASFFALPKKQVYGATKAYLTSFSRSLGKELKPHNISVTTICPGGLNTTTRLCYQNRIMGWISREAVLNPEDASKMAVDAMLDGQTLLIPGFINKCLMVLDKILPEFIKDRLAERELNKLPRLQV
ncbi:SDR family NAD(P)-dependent oxidoreductase [Gaetbulibacter saemankumensis]|uniref:SDR family NAD(P)-dependent oxidoreductase n=1 Tax=Gaetbulibacter saemankumensis TaxID=311208 RepID=UPI00042457FF|nr:SDR family NAD(P)-dependent oxidoreductase [Gaetbulibacter saemankumensis]